MPFGGGGGGGGGAALTVVEEDGSPSVASVDTIKVPNGSLTDLGSGDVSIRQVPTGFIGARAHNSAAVSVATGGAGTIITLDSERFDSDAYHSTSTNTGRMAVPAGMGGKHYLSGTVRFASSALGERRLELLLNGTTVIAAQSEQGVIASACTVNVSTVYDLAATDYVEMRAYQDSGGALNVEAAGNFTPEFVIVKLDSGMVGTGVGAKATNAAAQAIVTATATTLTFDAEAFDTDGFHSTSVNTGRLTIPGGLGGKYVVVAEGYWSGATGGVERDLMIQKNGATGLANAEAVVTIAPNASPAGQSVLAVVDAVPGDYFTVEVYHDRGSNLNFNGRTLSIMRLDSGSDRHSTVDATLGGDVTMATANTFYDGPSAVFAAGTWLIWWQAGFALTTTGQTHGINTKLWDGTTVYGESGNSFPVANTLGTLPQLVFGVALVTLSAAATLKVSATDIRASTVMQQNGGSNSASSNSTTRLVGIRIA